MTVENIDLWVSALGSESPYYRFYADSSGSQELTELTLLANESYTFYRLNQEISHPFFISDTGYKQTSSDAILITGDGSPSAGIIGDQSFRIEFTESEGAIEQLLYYCTTHTEMQSEFLVSDSSGVSSAYDEIARSTEASSINISDHYANAYAAELEFLSEYPEEEGTITITFESDNGWLNVDGTDPAATYQYIAGTSSPYASSSPAAPGANARTTLVASDATGQHLDGSAGGTIEYIHPDPDGVDTATRVHFSFNNVGHVVSVDEPDLARLNESSNIDRGINITNGTDVVAGGDYDQFLEVMPSENTEGGLTVSFAGITATGDTFENPINAFGFYLMGREQKRDVTLEVVDIFNNTILEYLTVEPTDVNSAVVEYISFAVDEGDAPIASFSLIEEFDGEAGSERDIFSIDDLSITPATSSGVSSAYDEIARSTEASSINISDHYANAYAAELEFLSEYPEEEGTITITFESDNGWLNVDGTDPAATYQYIAGTSSPYASSSPAAPGANARTTLVASDATGQHLDGSAGGTIEYIHPDPDGVDTATRVHFSFNNVGHVVSVDEPDLARLNESSNIDRGINITNGTDVVAGGDYDQFLEVMPSENTEGGLTVSFAGITATGDTFENPINAFGFYLMGREQKRDVTLEVVDIFNNTILEYLTVEPTDVNSAVVEYISFAVDEGDAPIASFSLIEEFDGEAGSERDIFSIDDLSIAPAAEIPFLYSIDNISTQESIKSFTLSEPVFLGSQDIDAVIIGTSQKDKLTGTAQGEILSGMEGKDKLKGYEGADGFLFHQSGGLGREHADRIKDFDSTEGDSIVLDNDLFGLDTEIELKLCQSKKDVRKALKSEANFVYDERKGFLYFNQDGEEKGSGDGGLFAKLKGAPELGVSDFTIV